MAPQKSKTSKQAERRAKKDTQEGEEETSKPKVDGGSPVALAKSLILGSVLVESAPKLQHIVTDAINDLKAGKPPMGGVDAAKAEPPTNGGDKTEGTNGTEGDEQEQTNGTNGTDAHEPVVAVGGAASMFNAIKSRFAWYNCLGLAAPYSGDEALKAWTAMKNLEVDGGPRAKRRGNPGLERMAANVTNYMAQYLHMLLVLMMLRAFLFRSYFACLPWLVLYQFLSVFIPLEKIKEVPQVDLAKVDVRFRVAAAVGLNALVWLFFAYEALWATWFFEKPLYVGIIAIHAYIVRPAE